MSLTEININDLEKLKQLRYERLLGFFTVSLPCCQIQIDTDHTLAIHCLDSKVVDKLLDDFEDLRSYAWLILGVKAIALYFCQEEILRTDVASPSLH
jgi:hypothetical protein